MLTTTQYERARLPLRYRSQGLEAIQDPKLGAVASKYVGHAVPLIRAGYSLFLTGVLYHEHSLAAAAIVKAALQAKLTAYCTDPNELQRAAVHSEYASHDEYGVPVPTVEYAERVDLLWVYNVGIERDDSFIRSLLVSIFGRRFVEGRATLITSPLYGQAAANAIQQYGSALISPIHTKRLKIYEVPGGSR